MVKVETFMSLQFIFLKKAACFTSGNDRSAQTTPNRCQRFTPVCHACRSSGSQINGFAQCFPGWDVLSAKEREAPAADPSSDSFKGTDGSPRTVTLPASCAIFIAARESWKHSVVKERQCCFASKVRRIRTLAGHMKCA